MSPCGSVVEHTLGKGEAVGSIPAMGSIYTILLEKNSCFKDWHNIFLYFVFLSCVDVVR